MKTKLTYPIVLIFTVLLGLFLWEFFVWWRNIPEFILPPPSAVIEEIYASRLLLWQHTKITILASGLGLISGAIIAFIFSVISSLSKFVEYTLIKLATAAQSMPKVVMVAPLIILWTGYGLIPKVLICALLTFFPVLINLIGGLKNIESNQLFLMDIYGASGFEKLIKVRLPSSIPFLFAGLKIATPLSLVGAVLGELISGDSGLGYLAVVANSDFNVRLLMAVSVILGIIGVIYMSIIDLLGNTVLARYTKNNK